jgi:hypothetical protein
MTDAYVPLTFAPGEAYQFDWSHEIVVMNGVTTIVKVAHVRLCHSRMMFVCDVPRFRPAYRIRVCDLRHWRSNPHADGVTSYAAV